MRPLLAASFLLCYATPASAQLRDVTDEIAPLGRIRGQAGLHLEYVRPEGNFGNYVRDGFGASGYAGVALDHHAQIILGLEAGIVNYGRESNTLPLSPTLPGLFVDLTTTNNIVTVGIPLRVELTRGALRPYLAGSVGLAYFWTETSASGTSSAGDFASTTNFHDGTRNWTAGGGLALRISNGKTPMSIDIGMRHVANGEVNYLTPGSIVDVGGGVTEIHPTRSEANFTLYQVGMSFGLR